MALLDHHRAAEIAWSAGLYEGEGHVKATRKNERCVYQLHITVAMTDQDVLERLHRVMGEGNVTGPYLNRASNHKKPVWVWAVGKNKAVVRCLELWWPWLGERRRAQARAAVEKRRASKAGVSEGATVLFPDQWAV